MATTALAAWVTIAARTRARNPAACCGSTWTPRKTATDRRARRSRSTAYAGRPVLISAWRGVGNGLDTGRRCGFGAAAGRPPGKGVRGRVHRRPVDTWRDHGEVGNE